LPKSGFVVRDLCQVAKIVTLPLILFCRINFRSGYWGWLRQDLLNSANPNNLGGLVRRAIAGPTGDIAREFVERADLPGFSTSHEVSKQIAAGEVDGLRATRPRRAESSASP
jgi:hypothetical protein